jgi:excisionase family DNA binding protein
MDNVFTPATLAERWDCSERHVRNLINKGKLGCFKLGGKLVRIRQSDVEKFECQSGGLPDLTENSASPGTKPVLTDIRSEGAIVLELPTRERRKPVPRLDIRKSPGQPEKP